MFIRGKKVKALMVIVIMLLQIALPAVTVIFENVFTKSVMAVDTLTERRF